MKHLAILCGLVAFLVAQSANAASYSDECRAIIASKGKTNDSARLQQLFDVNWRYTMEQFPETATAHGYPGRHRTWTDYSPAAIQARKAALLPTFEAVKSIEPAGLSSEDKTSLKLFRRNVEEDISGTRFPSEYLALNQMGGVPQDIPQTLQMMRGFRADDYDDMIARIEAVPKLIQQTIALLQAGLDKGITPPRITLREVPQQVRNLTPEDPWQSPLLSRFARFPESIPVSERESLRGRALAAYKTNAVPALKELYQFVATRYVPAARESIGLSELPNGREWYAYRVHESTTTYLTPEEIHKLGLAEVKRLRAEMEKLIESTGFKGSFAQFSRYLQTDSRFFYERPDDLLQGYRDIAKRVDPELVKLFGHLPRLPYGVIPVPSYSEKAQTTAYYEPGTLRGGRAGYFYANTYDLKTRPKWEMEALTLHEAVPGHHLQISIAQELDLPEFRRNGGYTAFVEGWGLYAESLGREIGFYTDPYSRFGQLTYEMWRAIRLVLDTGIHSMGWSRDEALGFFRENSSKTDHDIIVEVDRYIAWPGQALAYKIGQLKISELRHRAEKELGPKYDLRRFHDAVLGSGPLPLDMLEEQVQAWIKAGG